MTFLFLISIRLYHKWIPIYKICKCWSRPSIVHHPPSRTPSGAEPKETGEEQNLTHCSKDCLYAAVNRESQVNLSISKRTRFTYMLIPHMLQMQVTEIKLTKCWSDPLKQRSHWVNIIYSFFHKYTTYPDKELLRLHVHTVCDTATNL